MPFRPSPRQPSDHHTDTFQTIPQTLSTIYHRCLPDHTTDTSRPYHRHLPDTFQTENVAQTQFRPSHRHHSDHHTDTIQTTTQTPLRQTPFRPSHHTTRASLQKLKFLVCTFAWTSRSREHFQTQAGPGGGGEDNRWATFWVVTAFISLRGDDRTEPNT